MSFQIFTLILFISCISSRFSYGDSLVLTGNPSKLSISSAAAGQQPNTVTDSSTSYSIISTNKALNITGSLSSNLPSNVTLKIKLQAPTGGTSMGNVSLTTTAQNLVTGIPKKLTVANLLITYTLSATVQAAQVSNGSTTITLNLQ